MIYHASFIYKGVKKVDTQELNKRLNGVDLEECGFCKRRYDDGEIAFIGPIKGSALRSAGYCCMQKLEAIEVVDYVAPPSMALARNIHNLLFGNDPEPFELGASHQSMTFLAQIPVKSTKNPTRDFTPLSSEEIITKAVKVPRENWPEQVHNFARAASHSDWELNVYQWPDGVSTALGTYGAPSEARLIESYRKAALLLLDGGQPQ
jgi:hypothetical protein